MKEERNPVKASLVLFVACWLVYAVLCMTKNASIVNAFACFGIVLANFGFGYLADLFDWNVTILVWIGMAALGGLFCFLAARFWKRFLKKRRVI